MRTWPVLILAALATAGPAAAQAADAAPRAVDQTVEDLDPRAASLRVIDPGNAQFPTRSTIVENAHAARWAQANPGEAGPRRYEYRAPGVRALMRRPDYIVIDQAGQLTRNAAPLVDGGFRTQAPPDTVFSLTPDAPTPLDPAYINPDWQDPRIDGRVDYNQPRYIDPGTAARPPQTTATGERYIIRRIHTKTYKDQNKAPAEPEATNKADDAEYTDDADNETSTDQTPAPEPEASPNDP